MKTNFNPNPYIANLLNINKNTGAAVKAAQTGAIVTNQSSTNTNLLIANLQNLKGQAAVMPTFVAGAAGKSTLTPLNMPYVSNLEDIMSNKGLILHIATSIAWSIHNKETASQAGAPGANATDNATQTANTAADPAQTNGAAAGSTQTGPTTENVFAILVFMFEEMMKMQNKVSQGESATAGEVGELEGQDIEINSKALALWVMNSEEFTSTQITQQTNQMNTLSTDFTQYMNKSIGSSMSFLFGSAVLNIGSGAAGSNSAWGAAMGGNGVGGIVSAGMNTSSQLIDSDFSKNSTIINNTVSEKTEGFNEAQQVAAAGQQSVAAGTSQSIGVVQQLVQETETEEVQTGNNQNTEIGFFEQEANMVNPR